MSESFKLPLHIEEFLLRILLELPSDEPLLKELRLSIIELIFLIKQRDVDSQRIHLPEDVNDLFTTIHVINALTDSTKILNVPEVFFTKSETLLGDGMRTTREEFIKSSDHFNRTADLQLLDLMNKSSQLEKSLTEFIRHLSTESTPYQNHSILSNIPTECILTRAKLFYQLHLQLVNALSIVDCNLSPGENFLTEQIRKGKIYLFSFKKHQLLGQSLQATELQSNHPTVYVHFDVLKAENSMFHQAYSQLNATAHDIFRKKKSQLWTAQYLNMHSTDQGGPYRDSITRICSDICSTRLPLFILCPNGRTETGSNRDCWIPNVFSPNNPIPEKLKKQYRFVGQLMGLAIRKKHYLNVKFAPLLWKGLLFDSITIDDIQAIDLQSLTLIHEIEKQIEQAKLVDTDTSVNYIFNSIFDELHFEVLGSTEQTFELIPGGSHIAITTENFKEYSSHYRQYRLNEFDRQIEFIRQGLHSVIPCYYLNLLTANELEEIVCGKDQIDVELLKRNTTYRHGYNRSSPVIERFWTVFNQMFNAEQKKMFLVFVWGRSTLPMRDADFTSKFIIDRLQLESGNIDQALPQSHTCSFAIDLPEYSTTEIMYERLNYAITYCSSIDGDGQLNEATDDHDDDSSDSD